MKQEPIDIKHVGTYIGPHAYTPEYQFQEEMRKNDLGIKDVMEKFDVENGKAFFISGWGQIIGALIALKDYKISTPFSKIVEQNIASAIEKGKKTSNPFLAVNVREHSKNIMMYPHQGKYLPWQRVNINKPISFLNSILKKCPVKFALVEGKIYLQIGQKGKKTIFADLWESDFAGLLREKGYCDLEANKEHPHITLIHSNVIAVIKEKFIKKYGPEGESKFNNFIDSWTDIANSEFFKEDNPLMFTQFDSTYSEDYPPFEEVVVARLQAPGLKKILKTFVTKIEEEINYTPKISDKDSFNGSY